MRTWRIFRYHVDSNIVSHVCLSVPVSVSIYVYVCSDCNFFATFKPHEQGFLNQTFVKFQKRIIFVGTKVDLFRYYYFNSAMKISKKAFTVQKLWE